MDAIRTVMSAARYIISGICIGLCIVGFGWSTAIAQSNDGQINSIASNLSLDWPTALKDAKDLCKQDPANIDALALYGLALVRSGNMAEARVCLSRIDKDSRASYWPSLLQGRLMLWENDVPGALSLLAASFADNQAQQYGWQIFYSAYLSDLKTKLAFDVSSRYSDLLISINRESSAEIEYDTYSIPIFDKGGVVTEAILPFTSARTDCILVKISINGQPMTMLVDTGGTGIVLNRSAGLRLKLRPLGQGSRSGNTGTEDVAIMSADLVEFGSMRTKFVPVEVIDHDIKPETCDGIIGLSVLRQFDIIINMKEKNMHIKTAHADRNFKATYVIPFHLAQYLLLMDATINGEPSIAMLDSGDSRIHLSYALARRLNPMPKPRDTSVIDAPSDSIGKTIHEVKLLVCDQQTQLALKSESGTYNLIMYPLTGISGIDSCSKSIGIEISMSLGVLFFSLQNSIEIDYPHHMLYIYSSEKS